MTWRSVSIAWVRRFAVVAFAAKGIVEREFPPSAAPPAVILRLSHRDLLRICDCTQPVRDHLLLLAWAGRAGKFLFGGRQCGGECRIALPQESAHVHSVFVGSLGVGP
jgi:hypothetical protein